jgi:hypothetical protein
MSNATPTSLPPLDTTRAIGAPEGGEVGPVQSGWRLAAHEFSRNRLALVGLGLLVFFVLFCFVGPLIYHVNLNDTELTLANLPPGASHPLGTDDLGIDTLGELMKGGQAALEIGFFAAVMGIGIGALWGAIAGLAGGGTDTVLMRVVDVFLSVPFLFVILIVAVRYGATILSLSLIIGAFTWLVPARLVRGEVLTLKTRDFVAAARAAGSDPPAPAAERAGCHDRQRHVQRRGRHPGRGHPRLPGLRPALPAGRLGRHAVQGHYPAAERLLVAGVPGRYRHRAGGYGVQPAR